MEIGTPQVARHAKVDVRIWDDERVMRLSPIPPCGQGLWIRLLVTRHRSTIPGLLCVGEAALAEEFGWPLQAFREAFTEALLEGLLEADWKARLIWIPTACLYNRPESLNVVKAWRIPWDEAPECQLKVKAFHILKAFTDGLGLAFAQAFAQACADPSPKPRAIQEQEQEQEQEQDPPDLPIEEDLSTRDDLTGAEPDDDDTSGDVPPFVSAKGRHS